MRDREADRFCHRGKAAQSDATASHNPEAQSSQPTCEVHSVLAHRSGSFSLRRLSFDVRNQLQPAEEAVRRLVLDGELAADRPVRTLDRQDHPHGRPGYSVPFEDFTRPG